MHEKHKSTSFLFSWNNWQGNSCLDIQQIINRIFVQKKSLPSNTVAELHIAQPQNCIKLPMDNFFFKLEFSCTCVMHLVFFFFLVQSMYQFHPGSLVYLCSYLQGTRLQRPQSLRQGPFPLKWCFQTSQGFFFSSQISKQSPCIHFRRMEGNCLNAFHELQLLM